MGQRSEQNTEKKIVKKEKTNCAMSLTQVWSFVITQSWTVPEKARCQQRSEKFATLWPSNPYKPSKPMTPDTV